jgi:predicted negative regulator of RcsB-dependent stress response
VDRAHRHDLKHDKFVEQVGHTVEYATEHKQDFLKWGGVALALLVLAAGWYYYSRYQAGKRQEALYKAVQIQQAQVGPKANPFIEAYPTEAEKFKALEKAWSDLANSHPGTLEGLTAHFYLGVNAADRGNVGEAEKHFKIVADSGNDELASQGKLSLAQIYNSQGKVDDAEKLLRSVVNDPTIIVSKEQATVLLARVLAKKNPAEARKVLEPLRAERSAVSRAALTALGELNTAAK